MKTDLSFACRVLDGAKRRRADLAEVYLRSSRSLSVEVKDRQVEAVETSVDFGCALRVIKDGRLGFAFSTGPDGADFLVEEAVEGARWSGVDGSLDLPESAGHKSLDIFDGAVASLTEEEAVGKALDIEGAALAFDPRIKKVRRALFACSSGTELLLNTKGLEKTFAATSCSAQITVLAGGNGDSRTGWDFDGSRFLKRVDCAEVGRGAAGKATALIGARRMKPVKADVILSSLVATEFLGIFESLLSSEAVQKGKSLLEGRTGDKVVSPCISIVDDGLLEERLGSRPFDGEGVPTFGKALIENGILRRYMYNTYTARKDKVESTGNARRPGYSSLPAVGAAVFFIRSSADHVSMEDLLALPERCLHITDVMGMHTANPVSGEFSVGASGIWMEGGIEKYPVSEVVISGNILDFFSKVRAVGGDTRFYGNTGSPCLLVESVDISA